MPKNAEQCFSPHSSLTPPFGRGQTAPMSQGNGGMPGPRTLNAQDPRYTACFFQISLANLGITLSQGTRRSWDAGLRASA